MLPRLTVGTSKCSICGISYYNTQKLENHIKSKHLKKSSHKCNTCGQYFGDSQSLKVQKKKHAKGGYTLECEQYHKKYPSRGKLNEHKETHQDWSGSWGSLAHVMLDCMHQQAQGYGGSFTEGADCCQPNSIGWKGALSPGPSEGL